MAQSFRQIVGASPSTASPKDSTLDIIDAQNEYAEGKLKVSNAPESRKAIAGLLQKYREGDGKIVHVKHIVPDGAPVFTPKTKLAEEFDELAPKEEDKVIEKVHPSSFVDTKLHDYLGETGGKKIVLTGLTSAYRRLPAMVPGLATMFLVAEDAIGDRDIPGASGADVTKMVLAELGDAFATVVHSKDIK